MHASMTRHPPRLVCPGRLAAVWSRLVSVSDNRPLNATRAHLSRIGSAGGEAQVGRRGSRRLLPPAGQQGLQGGVGRGGSWAVAAIAGLGPSQAGQEVPAGAVDVRAVQLGLARW